MRLDHPDAGPSWLAQLLPLLPGVLGRALYHFDQVRRGKRPALGVLLLIELAIAIPMGFVGDGTATWMGLDGKPALAIAIVVAYLGPRGLEIAFERWLAGRKKAEGAAP